MQVDSFLCGFEPTLDVVLEDLEVIDEPKVVNRSKDIEAVFNAINGKKSLFDIGQELKFSRRLVSYCIEKLKNRVEKVGSKHKSSIYARNNS